MTTDGPEQGAETLAFAGPDDEGWYRTQIPDWISLHPELTHTADRLFRIVRSLILEKQPKKIRVLSYDQLAFLLPGKNGKPTSVDAIKDALKALDDIGLITNPDEKRVVSSTGKGGIQNTQRSYQLNDWPTEGHAYAGWRNAFDKLDAYTLDWRTSRSDVSPVQIDGGKNLHRTEQDEQSPDQHVEATRAQNAKPRPATTRKTAVRFDGGKKPTAEGKKPTAEGKKPENPTLNRENTGSLKLLPKAPSSSSSSEPRVTPDPMTAEEEDLTKNNDDRGARTPAAVIMRATDATEAEAEALVERIRTASRQSGRPIASLTRYVAAFPPADLAERLRQERERHRPRQGRHRAARATCTLHANNALPCGPCRGSLNAGGEDAQEIVDLFTEVGAQARPDLVDHPRIAQLDPALS